MAVVNVACPYCGTETKATVAGKPDELSVKKKAFAPSSFTWSSAGCPEGHSFKVGYK